MDDAFASSQKETDEQQKVTAESQLADDACDLLEQQEQAAVADIDLEYNHGQALSLLDESRQREQPQREECLVAAYGIFLEGMAFGYVPSSYGVYLLACHCQSDGFHDKAFEILSHSVLYENEMSASGRLLLAMIYLERALLKPQDDRAQRAENLENAVRLFQQLTANFENAVGLSQQLSYDVPCNIQFVWRYEKHLCGYHCTENCDGTCNETTTESLVYRWHFIMTMPLEFLKSDEGVFCNSSRLQEFDTFRQSTHGKQQAAQMLECVRQEEKTHLLIEDFAWALHDRMLEGGDNAQMFDNTNIIYHGPPVSTMTADHFWSECYHTALQEREHVLFESIKRYATDSFNTILSALRTDHFQNGKFGNDDDDNDADDGQKEDSSTKKKKKNTYILQQSSTSKAAIDRWILNHCYTVFHFAVMGYKKKLVTPSKSRITTHYQCVCKPDGCKGKIKVIQHLNGDGTSLYEWYLHQDKHTRHNTYRNPTGVPPLWKLIMDMKAGEWNRRHITPSQLTSFFENLRGGKDNKLATIPKRLQKTLTRHWQRMTAHSGHSHLENSSDAGTYGGMIQTIECFRKTNIPEFTRLTFYLVGDEYLADDANPSNQTVAGLLGCEESLLNLARKQLQPSCNGAVMHFDTMFKVDKNGWGIIVFGIMDRGQKHHNIAYCYTNRDSQRVHKFALDQIKAEVERLVEERIRTQGGIYM